MNKDETFIKRVQEPRCCFAGARNSMLIIVTKRSERDINNDKNIANNYFLKLPGTIIFFPTRTRIRRANTS